MKLSIKMAGALILAVFIINLFCGAKAALATDVSRPDYAILIYIEENRLYLCENGRCIKDYPIATGMPGWPSPIGRWKVTEKSDWGEGFGGYWLGLDVPWGEYGIHGTLYEGGIGYDVSHGCIRMRSDDVAEVYDMVRVGTSVLIDGGPFGSFGSGFRELTPGDWGADVMEVQKKLKALGYFRGKITGIYDDDLKFALYQFQEDNELIIKYTITGEDYKAMGIFEFE